MASHRPRVLLFSTHLPTDKDPVAGVFIYDQAEALRSRADVRVVRFEAQKGVRGVSVAQAPPTDWDRGVPTVVVMSPITGVPKVNALVRYIALWRLVTILSRRGQKPDIFHVHWWLNALPIAQVGRLRGIPTVITEHGSAWPTNRMPSKRIARGKRTFEAAARVLTVSRWLEGVLRDHGIRAEISVVPNVVDTSVFRHSSAPRNPRPVLMMTARMNPGPPKGVDMAIRAVGILRRRGVDVELQVAGDGSLRPELETLARTEGVQDRVSFVGSRTRSNIAQMLQGSDLFISASGAYETFGVAVAEALAVGVPVVATDVGAIPELVTPDRGILVAPNDPDLLADGVVRALARDWDRKSISAGMAYLTREAVASRLLAVYEEVARNPVV